MEVLKRILVVAITTGVAGVTGLASGQATTSPEAADQKSKDPYIEYRQEKKETKQKYKSGELSKGEYKQEKSKERTDLQKERAAAERDQPASGAGASTSSGR